MATQHGYLLGAWGVLLRRLIRVAFLAVLAPALSLSWAQSVADLQFFELVRNGSATQVKAAIEAGADVNAVNEYGHTPLMYAAAAGNVAGLRQLIEAGADLDATSADGWTAAMFAEAEGQPEALNLLISEGAEPPSSTRARKATEPSQPSHADSQKAESQPAISQDIHSAARDGNADLLEELLRAGADPNDKDTWGQTPLMYAAGADNYETTLFLLDAGADVNATSLAGWTALMYAARGAAAADTVELLLRRGADVHIQNEGGLTAADLASGAAAEALIAHEARQRAAAEEAARVEAEERAREARLEREKAEARALRDLQDSFSELVGEPWSSLAGRDEKEVTFPQRTGSARGWYTAAYADGPPWREFRIYVANMDTGEFCAWTYPISGYLPYIYPYQREGYTGYLIDPDAYPYAKRETLPAFALKDSSLTFFFVVDLKTRRCLVKIH